MKNDFDKDELARWWSHQNICFWCGRWHADSFHHVQGRSGRFADSILNAAPLSNAECHLPIHGRLRRWENRVALLKKTIQFLFSQGYEFTEKDKGFIRENEREYRAILGKGVRRPSLPPPSIQLQ